MEINKMDRKLKAYDYFNKNTFLTERLREIESKQPALEMSKTELSRATAEYASVVEEIKKHGRKQDAETD